jgi:uncharacterized protein
MLESSARSLTPILFGVFVFLTGCASYQDRMEPVDQAFVAGRYDEAQKLLTELKKDDSKNRHLYALNQGINDLALGRPQPALEELKVGRDRMDELSGANGVAWLSSVLTDDTALDYGGEDYEKILVRAVLALADLMTDGKDADAFALQVNEKQQEIMNAFEGEDGEKPKKAYKLVAFGSYVRGIINEGDPLTRDEAGRQFAQVVELAPEFPYGKADLERVQHGQLSQKGNGVVHVLAMVGRGPFKKEVTEPISSAALTVARWAWNLSHKRIVFPVISRIPIPAIATHPCNPTDAVVELDGHPVGQTATVTDVNATALQQFETMKTWIVARAVLRRVFKYTAMETAKEVAGKTGSSTNFWAGLAIDVAGAAWTGVENADTRCWSLLPAYLQALRFEAPAGDHTLTVYAGQDGRPVGPPQRVRIRVQDGFNTYVVALVPTRNGGPAPLTSDTPDADEKDMTAQP